VHRRLLVGEHRRGAIAGAHEVVDRLRHVAERRGHREVVGDRRKVRIEVAPVALLEPPADRAVQLEPLRGEEIVVQRLAHELVGEAEPPGRDRVLQQHAGGDRLGDQVEQPRRAQPARQLEDPQVELAADDGGDAQHRARLRREAADAAADQRPDLLGHARQGLGGVRRPAWGVGREQARDLLEEERVAACDAAASNSLKRTVSGSSGASAGGAARAPKSPPAARTTWIHGQ
jgi:hypothetical protein